MQDVPSALTPKDLLPLPTAVFLAVRALDCPHALLVKYFDVPGGVLRELEAVVFGYDLHFIGHLVRTDLLLLVQVDSALRTHVELPGTADLHLVSLARDGLVSSSHG